MKNALAWPPVLLAVGLGACAPRSAPPARQPPDTVVDLGAEGRVSYYSTRRGRQPAEEGALAVQGREIFCGRQPELACVQGGTIYIAIVSSGDVECAIVASGEKYRTTGPHDRVNAVAEFSCPGYGDPPLYREKWRAAEPKTPQAG